MAKTWEIQWVKDWIGMGQGSAPGKILCNKYTCVQHKFQLVAMSLSFNHKREVVNAQGVEQVAPGPDFFEKKRAQLEAQLNNVRSGTIQKFKQGNCFSFKGDVNQSMM